MVAFSFISFRSLWKSLSITSHSAPSTTSRRFCHFVLLLVFVAMSTLLCSFLFVKDMDRSAFSMHHLYPNRNGGFGEVGRKIVNKTKDLFGGKESLNDRSIANDVKEKEMSAKDELEGEVEWKAVNATVERKRSSINVQIEKQLPSFLRKIYKEKTHVCHEKSFFDCLQIVSHAIYARFMHLPSGQSRKVVVEEDKVLLQNGGEDADELSEIEPWATGVKVEAKGRRDIKFEVVRAFHAGGPPKKSEGYGRLDKKIDLNRYRFDDLVLQPKTCAADMVHRDDVMEREKKVPWLGHFRNVWVSGTGVVLVPLRRRRYTKDIWEVEAYEIGGGCCSRNWAYLLNSTFKIDLTKSATPLAFSVGQHHGLTFFHVMQNIVPRILSFWELLVAMPRKMKILVSLDLRRKRGAVVLQNILQTLGWPSNERLLKVDQYEFRQVKRLFVPAPFDQDIENYSKCFGKRSSTLLQDLIRGNRKRTVVKKKKQRAAGAKNGRKNTEKKRFNILLIDRAHWRKKGRKPKCRGLRCIGNLYAIKNSLEKKLGNRVRVKVTKNHKRGNSFFRTMQEFAEADCIIGGHGAGFQNQIFMRNGTYAIHLGWNKMWRLYANLAKEYGINFKNLITKGAGQNRHNIMADVRNVVKVVVDIVNTKESER